MGIIEFYCVQRSQGQKAKKGVQWYRGVESICKKGLQSTPKRLQRILLRLLRYKFEVVYKRGPEMYLADTLSRALLPLKTSLAGNKEQVMGVAEHSVTVQEVEPINMVEFLPVSELVKKIQKESKADKEMGMLNSTIREGWPETLRNVPCKLHDYFPVLDELVVQDSVRLQGRPSCDTSYIEARNDRQSACNAHRRPRLPTQSQRRHFIAWNEQGLGHKDNLLLDLPYA